MMRTYKGRYEHGKLILPEHERNSIPNTADVIITILDDEMSDNVPEQKQSEKKLTSGQKNVAQKFLVAMQELRKDGFSAEDESAISDLQSGKYKPVFEGSIKA